MVKIEQIKMCAIHKCARECDSEIRGIGDCMCHNLNWQKANEKDMNYCLTYQMDVAPANWKPKKSNKLSNGKEK
jgi:hypothetical protein